MGVVLYCLTRWYSRVGTTDCGTTVARWYSRVGTLNVVRSRVVVPFWYCLLPTGGCDQSSSSSSSRQNKKSMAHVVSMAVRAVRREGLVLQCLDATLRADPSVVNAAVANNGRALEFSEPRFQEHRGVVLAAVETTGTALQFAHPSLRADRDVVLSSVNIDCHVPG